MREDDPLTRYGPPLASVLLAVVLSILVAAMMAGQIEGEYQTRALIYGGFVLWVLLGAGVVFVLVHRGETARVSVSRILLWAASIWLWPLFLLLRRRSDGS